MNRADFMKQLESLLQNISQAEREEALQYYNDYFDDAGSGNEQAVIEALGNPAKVAENIKRDLFGTGAETVKVTAGDRVVIPYEERAEQNAGEAVPRANSAEHTEKSHKEKGKLSPGIIVLIVVLAILASPVLLGVAGTLLGILIGIAAVFVALLAAWFSLIVSFGAAALTLLVTAVVLTVVALLCVFGYPLIGVSVLGVGLLCGGIGLLFLMLTVCMAGIVTPAVWRWTGKLMRKLFGRKKQ